MAAGGLVPAVALARLQDTALSVAVVMAQTGLWLWHKVWCGLCRTTAWHTPGSARPCGGTLQPVMSHALCHAVSCATSHRVPCCVPCHGTHYEVPHPVPCHGPHPSLCHAVCHTVLSHTPHTTPCHIPCALARTSDTAWPPEYSLSLPTATRTDTGTKGHRDTTSQWPIGRGQHFISFCHCTKIKKCHMGGGTALLCVPKISIYINKSL